MRKQRIQAEAEAGAQVEIINMRYLQGGKCKTKKKNNWEK